jgi:hypothetical protein
MSFFALPVTYGSGLPDDNNVKTGHLREFEAKAYDYFANLQDFNLARVVQYTIIYQMFRALARDADFKSPFTDPKNVAANETVARQQSRAITIKRVEHLLNDVKVGLIKPPDSKDLVNDKAANRLATEFAELKALLIQSEPSNITSMAEILAYPADEARAIADSSSYSGRDAEIVRVLVRDQGLQRSGVHVDIARGRGSKA